jgi:hypothetical protein
LVAALRQIRESVSETSDAAIWIDGICINQTDIEERNSEVLLMPSIYKIASPAIDWLGPSADNSDSAVEMISGISVASVLQDSKEVPGQLDMQEHKGQHFGWPHQIQELWSKDFDTMPFNSKRRAIEALFRRPYWSRV